MALTSSRYVIIIAALFLGVARPGVMGDRDALKMVKLGSLVESFPGLVYCVIGNCAYTATGHLVPIYQREMAQTQQNDNFDLFASQLRIRIEMAFGLIVKKWEILSRPQSMKIIKMKRLMVAIARLHSFYVNERLTAQQNNRDNLAVQQDHKSMVFAPMNVSFTAHETMLCETAADFD